MIAYDVCNLAGRRIAPIVETAENLCTVSIAINAGRSCTVVAHFDDEASAFLKPLQYVVKATWEQGALFTGKVIRPVRSGSARTVTAACRDGSAALQASFIGDNPYYSPSGQWPFGGSFNYRSYSAGRTGEFSSMDQSAIMGLLCEMSNRYFDVAGSGVEHGLNHGMVPGVYAGGLSGTKQRARVYEYGKNVLEAMQELANVIDGVDFDLRPLDLENGQLQALDTYYPQMGRDVSDRVVFEYGWGLQNASDITIDEAGDVVRTTSTHMSQAFSLDQSVTDAGLQTYGKWSAFTKDEGGGLGAYVDTLFYGQPPSLFTLTPAQQDGSGYRLSSGTFVRQDATYGAPPTFGPQGDYWLGDTIGVDARDGIGLQYQSKARVVGVTMQNLSSGDVAVQLTLAPLLGSGLAQRGVVPPTFLKTFEALAQKVRMIASSATS